MPKRRKTTKGSDPEAEAFAPPKTTMPEEDQGPDLSTNHARFARWSAANMTALEKRVWKWMGKTKNPWGFIPQYPHKAWTLDFFSPQFMLGIEADGPAHLKTVREDEARDRALEKDGILTLRLTRGHFVRYSAQRLFDLVEEVVKGRSAAPPKQGKPK